ncbi:MAG: response regulator [Chloroflexi bacterium]|nr:response regulator [Chloroflexota bacterium]
MVEKSVELLLVEDNPHDEELAVHALKRFKLAPNIVIVRDGAEALDFIFCRGKYTNRTIEDTPKIILLDLKLPKIDGLEVLEQIKKDQRTKKIPVVVLTSSDQEVDILKSYKLGVNSYVVKPVDFERFSETVKQLGLYWLKLNRVSV